MTEHIAIVVGLALIAILTPLQRWSSFPLPLWILIWTYSVIGFLGYVATTWFALPRLATEEQLYGVPQRIETLLSFVLCIVSVALGHTLAATSTLVLSLGKPEKKPTGCRTGFLMRSEIDDLRNFVDDIPSSLLAVSAVVPAVVYVVGRGFHTLLSSESYLLISGSASATKLGFVGLPVGAMAALILADRRGGARVIGTLITAGYLVLLFSAATRAMALMICSWTLLRVMHHGRLRMRHAAMTVLGLLVALSVPFNLRSSDAHGLIPYFSTLVRAPASVLKIDMPALTNNVLFAYPLTNYVAAQDLPPGSFGISVSPLPGGAAGWDEISRSLRVNLYVPFSAVGELAAYGGLATLVYMTTVAFLVSKIWSWEVFGSANSLGRLMVLATTALFALQSIQYNLRTVSRLVYLLIAAALILRFFASRSLRESAPDEAPQSTVQVEHV